MLLDAGDIARRISSLVDMILKDGDDEVNRRHKLIGYFWEVAAELGLTKDVAAIFQSQATEEMAAAVKRQEEE